MFLVTQIPPAAFQAAHRNFCMFQTLILWRTSGLKAETEMGASENGVSGPRRPVKKKGGCVSNRGLAMNKRLARLNPETFSSFKDTKRNAGAFAQASSTVAKWPEELVLNDFWGPESKLGVGESKEGPHHCISMKNNQRL